MAAVAAQRRALLKQVWHGGTARIATLRGPCGGSDLTAQAMVGASGRVGSKVCLRSIVNVNSSDGPVSSGFEPLAAISRDRLELRPIPAAQRYSAAKVPHAAYSRRSGSIMLAIGCTRAFDPSATFHLIRFVASAEGLSAMFRGSSSCSQRVAARQVLQLPAVPGGLDGHLCFARRLLAPRVC